MRAEYTTLDNITMAGFVRDGIERGDVVVIPIPHETWVRKVPPIGNPEGELEIRTREYEVTAIRQIAILKERE